MSDSNLLGNTSIIVAGAASITSGTAALTVVGAGFVSTDVGRSVTIIGGGVAGADLVTTISGYTSSTQVTLATNASTTITAVASRFQWNIATYAYSSLYTLMTNRTPVAMAFASAMGIAPTWVASTTVGKSKFAGYGIITSLSMNAPDADNGSYSFSMEGTGALAQTIN